MTMRQRKKIHKANVGDYIIRGSVEKIVSFAESKGYEADRMKDVSQAHYYWQIADHWRRVEP